MQSRDAEWSSLAIAFPEQSIVVRPPDGSMLVKSCGFKKKKKKPSRSVAAAASVDMF